MITAVIQKRLFLFCRIALVGIFLAWFASFYRAGFGFTYVLQFNRRSAETMVERMRDVPVYVQPGAGYDGQYYAQLAVDPLLKDPSIDGALDSPPFRARRILFSWTAWLIGLGRPWWVVQAYCIQNALFWLAFAVWLRWRLPGDTVEDLVVWAACLFTPGMLDSKSRGSRSSFHVRAKSFAGMRSRPVRTNPFSLRRTKGGSQSL